MPYARNKIWFTRPSQGNPRKIWDYAIGAYGPLNTMSRRFNGGVYEFGYSYTRPNHRQRPGAITIEALRQLKVIP